MKTITAQKTDYGKTEYFTIISILEDCELTLDKSKFQARYNDLVISREDLTYHSNKQQSLLVYQIQEEFFDNLFDSQISDCAIFHDLLHATEAKGDHLYFTKIGEDATNILKLLYSEFDKHDIYHEKIIRLLLVGLLTYLDRNHYDTLIVPKSTMGKTHEFGKIMKYIGDHYRDVTLESVAKKFGYHPDYLSYRFKKITGISFSKKLLCIRMEEAIHLLLTTEMTTQQIAEASGYHDRSHFSRNFKEYTGLTPKQYKIQFKTKQ